MINKAVQVKRAALLVQQLCEQNFYGRLEIRFEQGNIVHMTQSQSIKIEQVFDPGEGDGL